MYPGLTSSSLIQWNQLLINIIAIYRNIMNIWMNIIQSYSNNIDNINQYTNYKIEMECYIIDLDKAMKEFIFMNYIFTNCLKYKIYPNINCVNTMNCMCKECQIYDTNKHSITVLHHIELQQQYILTTIKPIYLTYFNELIGNIKEYPIYNSINKDIFRSIQLQTIIIKHHQHLSCINIDK